MKKQIIALLKELGIKYKFTPGDFDTDSEFALLLKLRNPKHEVSINLGYDNSENAEYLSLDYFDGKSIIYHLYEGGSSLKQVKKILIAIICKGGRPTKNNKKTR